jgi:carboxylate-amine ligase
MRYGIEGKLIDFGKREEVPMRFLALELIDLLDDVVDELGSRKEVAYLEQILKNGTSADRQIAVYKKSLAEGATEKEALNAVVDHVVEETMEGVEGG